LIELDIRHLGTEQRGEASGLHFNIDVVQRHELPALRRLLLDGRLELSGNLTGALAALDWPMNGITRYSYFCISSSSCLEVWRPERPFPSVSP
jgi:hypothetical protein